MCVESRANLLMTFSIYMIVYELSLGFTKIIEHVYRDYLHFKCVTLHTHSMLCVGTFDILFSLAITLYIFVLRMGNGEFSLISPVTTECFPFANLPIFLVV